jgi:hypothetical protein
MWRGCWTWRWQSRTGARCAGVSGRILLLEVEFFVEEEAKILVEQAAVDGEVRPGQGWGRPEMGREACDF